jgi:tape measure domain-containing protein
MPTVEEMRVVMDAETARLHRKLTEADRRMAQFQRDTAERLRRFDGYFRSAGVAAGGLVSSLGVSQIASYADNWNRVTRSLRASEDIFGMRLHSAEQLLDLANQARVDLESYTKTYQRAAAAIRDYGMGATEAAKMTTSLSMALKLGGSTAAEQASVLLQFSQALNKGKLDGDEFRTVMEAAPVVVELLADRLKKSKGEIINMAAEGKLRIKDLVGAMIDGGAKIERIFTQAPTTIDEAFQVLTNAVTAYVGRADEATGASRTLAAGIGSVSRNVDTVANSAMVLGAALLSVFGPRMVVSVAQFGAAATLALGPIGWLAAIAGGGAAAIALFGDEVKLAADSNVTLKDTAQALIEVLGSKLTPMLQQAGDLWSAAIGMISDSLGGVSVDLDKMLGAVRMAVNATVGLFVFAGKAIHATFATLPNAVGELFIEMANRTIATVEGMIRRMVDALNTIPGIKIDAEIKLGRIPNPLEGQGSRAKEAYADAGRQLGRDFVGEFSHALDSLGGEVAKRAREIREMKEWAANTKIERTIELKQGKPPVDKKLEDQMKKAAEKVGDVYRQALEAAGEYSEKISLEYQKEVREFQELLENKLISQKTFEEARQSLLIVHAYKMKEAMDREIQASEKVGDVYRQQLENQKRYREVVALEYVKDLREFQDQLDKKLITQEAFEQARQSLAVNASKKMMEAIEKEYEKLRQVTDIVASQMEKSFDDFMENGTFSIREFVSGALKEIAKLIFRTMVLRNLFGENGKGFGILGDIIGNMPKFAKGGRPQSGRAALTGEQGIELFLPDRGTRNKSGVQVLGRTGPEIFVPREPGTIVPHHKLSSLAILRQGLPGYQRGGRPQPGRAALTGEQGRELFVPDIPAARRSSTATARDGGGAPSVSVAITLNAPGAVRDTLPILERQVADLQRNMPRIILETVNNARDRREIW